jgi:hypothetical protein
VDTLKEHYVPEMFRDLDYSPDSADSIGEEIRGELERRITSDSEVTVTILSCDMDKGILSVRVDESYRVFNGTQRDWSFSKTAIVDW